MRPKPAFVSAVPQLTAFCLSRIWQFPEAASILKRKKAVSSVADFEGSAAPIAAAWERNKRIRQETKTDPHLGLMGVEVLDASIGGDSLAEWGFMLQI